MPWDTDDYPSSLKNLETPVRKKAIEIANAMLDEGYDEGSAIPIATEQAKEWYEDASEDEILEMKQKTDQKLKQRDPEDRQYDNRPELLDKGEHVVAHEDGWAVQAADAKKPAATFSSKDEAVDRAKEIASNKGTQVIIHRKDGTIQDHIGFSSQ
ncbi:DUF2188 domain-containing protein [Pontibacillus yanchengensis]|uniref:DUF2188 domain-containing protein n=1 Tax=Pontibacillus yanchengensis Y32 TaxID=1385514 RepID=A0A0A2TK25_9BACI|nr:DUF2188 domain-containing protein [Pontibacillus yanchengensis]KGP74426.1 hypothetical protein N782_12305 [Pontibacillus yanchengensis Y32]